MEEGRARNHRAPEAAPGSMAAGLEMGPWEVLRPRVLAESVPAHPGPLPGEEGKAALSPRRAWHLGFAEPTMLLPLPEEGGRGEAKEMAVDPTALGPESCLEA